MIKLFQFLFLFMFVLFYYCGYKVWLYDCCRLHIVIVVNVLLTNYCNVIYPTHSEFAV